MSVSKLVLFIARSLVTITGLIMGLWYLLGYNKATWLALLSVFLVVLFVTIGIEKTLNVTPS